MGRTKQLLPILGEPALILCLNRILAAGIKDVVVVVGHSRVSIFPLLEKLPVKTVVNPQPDSGMAESVQSGLAALSPSTTGIMVGLADHPLVLPSSYELLLKEHALKPDRILIPTYLGRGGHPTLFPASMCCRTDCPRPLNRIIAAHHDRVIRLEIDDPGIVMDMDHPADYRRLVKLAVKQQAASP